MANYLAISTAAANGADFTLAAGEYTTLNLTTANTSAGYDSGYAAVIQIKCANNQYQDVGTLTPQNPATVLDAIGTFRVNKPVSRVAAGVDRT